MRQRMEAPTQSRQMIQSPQYRMQTSMAQQVVRETPWMEITARTPSAREKKPNGDPCSLTLWGTEED